MELVATRLAVSEIAAALHVSPSSVAKYVQRLNQAVSGAFGGAGVRLVVPWAPGRGSGYALAVPASSTGPAGEG
jgi:DNA-binding IscR family transcriptional regulator